MMVVEARVVELSRRRQSRRVSSSRGAGYVLTKGLRPASSAARPPARRCRRTSASKSRGITPRAERRARGSDHAAATEHATRLPPLLVVPSRRSSRPSAVTCAEHRAQRRSGGLRRARRAAAPRRAPGCGWSRPLVDGVYRDDPPRSALDRTQLAAGNRAADRLARDTEVSGQRVNCVCSVRNDRISFFQPTEMWREPRRQHAQGVRVEFAQY